MKSKAAEGIYFLKQALVLGVGRGVCQSKEVYIQSLSLIDFNGV